jgi:uncharacterized protein YbjT (DUF2867 family)
MSHLITITGATGNVGRRLCELLLQNGVRVRAVARNAENLAPLAAQGAEAWVGDIEDTEFLTRAFRGADALFAMLPEHPAAPDFHADKRRAAVNLVEAVKASGVPRVVALSAIGAVPPSGIGPAVANGEFEEMLKSVPGLSVVVLRAAFLMENHLASIPVIRNAGINGSPARADVPVAMIATRDIATAAAEYLTNPTFTGYNVRELLGPRDYTYPEVTSILGAAIGKPDLLYVQFPYEDFSKGLVGAGLSPNLAGALVELYTAVNSGEIQRLADRTDANTTGTTLEEFARDVFAPVYNAS